MLMGVELLWSPQARIDLLEIYVAIGMDSVDAAERIYTDVESKAVSLIQFPRLGVRRSEIARTARMLVEGSYLLLYETNPDTDAGPIEWIEIVRVVDGRRDLSVLF